MSAVYLHNSLYNQEPRPTFPHSRNHSTLSSVTLQTSTTLHSLPTEPLLPQTNAPQEAYYRNTTSNFEINNDVHAYEENTVVESEKRGFLSPLRRRPLNTMQWLKVGLEAVISVWALYNAVRYFLAFTVYESMTGETISLALGISAGLSFAFLTCSLILSQFRPRLLCHGMSYGTVSTTYWTLIYLSLLCLIAPAAVNLAFVFVWKNASDLQLRPRHRCYLDIDVVWSKTHRMCKPNTIAYGVWVTLSSLRLAVTSAILFGYQFILHKTRPNADLLAKRFRGKHRINPSDTFSYQSALSPAAGVPFPAAPSPLLQTQQRQQSGSSISSRTAKHPRLSRSRSSGLSTAETRNMNEIASSILPKPELQQQQQAPTNNTNTTLASVPEQEQEDSMASFSERFASLVSEIDRETEAALEFARSEETSSRRTLESPLSGRRGGEGSDDELEDNPAYTHRPVHTPTPGDHDDDDDDFYRGGEPSSTGSRPRVPVPPALGYNEFGQPYPPDEDFQMFDRFIKRMPTIESMGSREMGSAGTASLLSARDANNDGKRGSLQTNKSHNTNNSRPPTRNAPRGSWVGSEFSFNSGTSPSEPSSRTNSLSFQVEKLAAMGFLGGASSSSGHGTSEYGELLDVAQPSVRRVVPESPLRTEFGAPDSLAAPERRYSSSTKGSGSTDVSYFTATTGSAKTGKSGIQKKEEQKEDDEVS